MPTDNGTLGHKLASDFESANDAINPLIVRAEKALARLRLGVSAAVELEPLDDEGWVSHLRFGKVDKDWGLSVDTGPAHDLDSQQWKTMRLHATSRATRLKALKILPALEQALIDLAQNQLDETLQTLEEASTYLAELERRAT